MLSFGEGHLSIRLFGDNEALASAAERTRSRAGHDHEHLGHLATGGTLVVFSP